VSNDEPRCRPPSMDGSTNTDSLDGGIGTDTCKNGEANTNCEP